MINVIPISLVPAHLHWGQLFIFLQHNLQTLWPLAHITRGRLAVLLNCSKQISQHKEDILSLQHQHWLYLSCRDSDVRVEPQVDWGSAAWLTGLSHLTALRATDSSYKLVLQTKTQFVKVARFLFIWVFYLLLYIYLWIYVCVLYM